MDADPLVVTWQVLRAAAQLVEGIQQHVMGLGFDDISPVHGYAFARISSGDATVVDVAGHLGTTKQAASQLVEYLVQRGYVARGAHPEDARARLLSLTARGRACTRAAEEAAGTLVAGWRDAMGVKDFAALHRGLGAVVSPGPVRPTW